MKLINIKHIPILLIFIYLFSFTVLSAEQDVEKDYQRRILGDQAFNDGLYDVAINYYKHYLKNAGSNTGASRDAYYCLIATFLKANNIKEAEKFYKKVFENNEEYFKKNPIEEEQLKYWNAEIILAKGLTNNAKTEFEQIELKTKGKNKEIYYKALIGKGICDIRLKDWKSAENSFQIVYDISEAKDAKAKAVEQLILVKILSGKVNEAIDLIKEQNANSKKESNSIQLLRIYTLLKENKIDEAEKEFTEISSKLRQKDTVLSFLVLSYFANIYIKEGGFDKALKKLQEAFSNAPGLYEKEEIAVLTLNTLIEAERLNEAEKSAKMFLEFFPNSILRDKILLTYISILIKRDGNTVNVYQIVEKYYTLKKRPVKVQVDSAIEIGKLLYQVNDYKNALIYFDYSYINGTDRNQCGEALFWEGKCNVKLENISKALEVLKKIDSKLPEWHEQAMYEIGVIYLENKEFKNAKNEWDKFIKLFPNSKIEPSPYFLYATSLAGCNHINEAIQEYLKFANNGKDKILAAEAYCRTGDLNLRLAKFNNSIDCYKQVLSKYPDSNIIPEVLYKILYSYYLSGGYEKAVQVVKDLNNNYPDNNYSQQASFWLVDYYAANEKYSKAMDQLDEISSRYNNNEKLNDKIIYEKADLYFKMKKFQPALNTIDKIINRCKDNERLGRAYYLQGDIYSEKGDFDKAIEAYKQVLALKVDNELKIAAQGRIGDCYFAVINFTDDRNEAIKLSMNAYKELLNYQKLSIFIIIQTNYKLGKCYEILGDTESAKMCYYKALYENKINDGSKVVNDEWLAKSGIALTHLLLEEDTQETAERAIKVYEMLIKFGIQPVDDYRNKINQIMEKYEIKENV